MDGNDLLMALMRHPAQTIIAYILLSLIVQSILEDNLIAFCVSIVEYILFGCCKIFGWNYFYLKSNNDCVLIIVT